ncbi:hypothetical protein [Mesorhizobium retamae]|uniref:Phage portal protein n=1 Tax=Mesorhizobium retamae TaxID=2912854 RepID=A0ABS9QN43_9HYPH|nr:hypothetical protein [Mesorhizobium sp. IRAMC:0171]MCG7508876.1 hypothetical protein [Mesorhizobium sp. IRAMC:0171]
MTKEELEALAEVLAVAVRDQVDAATRPLLERIASLEERKPEKGEKGDTGERGSDGQTGRDGKDSDPATVQALVSEAVNAAVRELPTAKDGRDGVGVAGAVIDRTGNLILTLSDGTTRDLGPVVGKDGVAGRDGLGFEDMSEELADDGRTIIRRYSRGDQVKEFRHQVSVVLDRGVYKEGHDYEPGDGVTWGGSFWIAQQRTTEKPDGGEGWRLAVKRGRDGKDAPSVTPAAKGPIRVGNPAREV